MARRPQNVLRVIRTVLSNDLARPILGELSPEDLDTLSDHLSAGTLMEGITPLADAATKAEALRAMPRDLANVVAKIPADRVADMRVHLNGLDRDGNNDLKCGC